MKKSTLIFLLASCLVLAISATELGKRRDGSLPGYSGSPGDSLKTCTMCHGGTQENVDGWITSNIPSTGFVPGQAYLITAKNINIGYNRFGFEVSPQAYNGTLLGKLEEYPADSFRTKLVGEDKYVTYSSNGIDGLDSTTWTFRWIAPDSPGVNMVTFWGAFNSNLDGHKWADHTTTSQLVVYKEGFSGMNDAAHLVSKAYPIPLQNHVYFDLLQQGNTPVQVFISGIDSKQVELSTTQSGNRIEATLPELSEGTYFLTLKQGNKVQVIKALHLN